jgi:hypothetical protein
MCGLGLGGWGFGGREGARVLRSLGHLTKFIGVKPGLVKTVDR